MYNTDFWDIIKFRQRRKDVAFEQEKAVAELQLKAQDVSARREANDIKRSGVQAQYERMSLDRQIHNDKMAQDERHHIDSMTLEREITDTKISGELEKQRRDHNFQRMYATDQANSAMALENTRAKNEANLKLVDAELTNARRHHDDVFGELDHVRDITKGTSNALNTAFNTAVSRLMDRVVETKLAKGRQAEAAQQQAFQLHQQREQHRHEIEIEQLRHLNELKKMALAHGQATTLAIIEAELRDRNYTHQQMTNIAVRLIERALGLREANLSREKVAEWIKEFEAGDS